MDDCDQECINTLGSYSCSCRDGYRLLNDERSCTGTMNTHIYIYIIAKWNSTSRSELTSLAHSSYTCMKDGITDYGKEEDTYSTNMAHIYTPEIW